MSLEPQETVKFGRYEIVRPIGEGGMARVYLGLQRGPGGFERRLVLKVLHPKMLGSVEAAEMFLEEARVLARLQHPNIVGVFEVGNVAEVPYIAIEYVHGPTLGRLFRFVGRPRPDAVGIFLHLMSQVCDALHHAHTLTIDGRPVRIVHRDVSSQNIVIEAKTGLAKLIDFGIAKADDAEHETQVGILKGRIHYIAPEVLGGARPDARADLYAVGVMLHRMLLGRMPFRDNDLVTRRTPLQLDERALPPGVAPIILRALAPDPDARWASAHALSEQLRAVTAALRVQQADIPPFVARVFPRGELDWFEGDPVVESVPPPAPRPARPGRWMLAGLVFAAALLLASVTFAGLVIGALLNQVL